ncbi:hypothetical protein CONPUDRAFT_133794 [Coniophora puteana RWD-64-598 SS2]|uniref:UV radiation resistance-associated gene protein n=1 Tax=Coniophora puteana (strain RWD-64-598) TaxID=741705 RepID=A0A5M3N656_CONPW|nr:uncharacterized protein CONPUDRAFT_133794 [Coniophora puteana RWD-64-598 SS2]EIW86351.1 hypothetical protein CONPUDRAFT_133794 [Coniophora puteana RWD-64-598 SS2]
MSEDAHNALSNSPPNIPWHLSDYQDTFQHRLRHITSIQIRNFTPFPARDAVASALLQPASHSQFTAHGHYSDDLDVTVARRRSRRISTSSINTLRSIRADPSVPFTEGSPPGVSIPDMKGRRRTQSKVSFTGAPTGSMSTGAGSKPSRQQPPSPTIHPTRPSFRNRTSSIASGNIPSASALSAVPSSSTYTSTSGFFMEYNQKKLEEVVDSRLVESFITIKVPSRTNRVGSRTMSASGSRPSSPVGNSGDAYGRPRTQSQDNARFRPKDMKAAMKDSPVSSKAASKIHKSSLSMPSKAGPSQSSALNGGQTMTEDDLDGVPDYMSPIHRPSTNPAFTIDGRSSYEFAEWTDRSTNYFHVQLWAKTGSQVDIHSSVKGKGKEKETQVDGLKDWKVLEEWDVHLQELVPLSEELSQDQFSLPSNTLLVTFSSSDTTFYLPKPPPKGRSRSPSPGYTSDPEATTAVGDLAFPRHSAKLALPKVQTRQRSRRIEGRSSSWQDLLQLATLQACIRDNQQSLNKIVDTVSDSLRADAVTALMRDVSERETRIRDRQDDRSRIMSRSNELRELIARKKESLRSREAALASAKGLMDEGAAMLASEKLVLVEERKRLMSLRNQLTPLRTRLIATLSFIFPIDLRSPEDLLYTILSVPLPIPLNKTDPAPPLSWSAHKDVNEDSVATALGYAALAIHLLAAYMGKALVYPVTYIGSRSLIRDNISAMVGPRMFPLFSRGVDTYRFEYGVFLLNKNIELLMVDETPTMDIRHTLFNLKNLLLILSDGECASSAPLRISESPMSSGLVTPPPQSPPSLTLDTEGTGSEANGNADVPTNEDSQGDGSGSGAVTPTASSNDGSAFSRYSRISIGLPQLPGFWRSRTSSSIAPSVKRETENGHPVHANGSAADGEASTGQAPEQPIRDDEDDRRTIRGLDMDHSDGTDERKQDVKTPAAGGVEKSAKEIGLQKSGLTSSVPAR